MGMPAGVDEVYDTADRLYIGSVGYDREHWYRMKHHFREDLRITRRKRRMYTRTRLPLSVQFSIQRNVSSSMMILPFVIVYQAADLSDVIRRQTLFPCEGRDKTRQ